MKALEVTAEIDSQHRLKGAVPPFGTLYGLPTLMDESLAPDALLVFEGHTHFEAIRMLCRDYERLEHPIRLRFAEPGNGK